MTSRNVFFLLVLSLVALVACDAAGGRLGRYPTSGEPTPIPTAPAAAKATHTVARGDVTARLTLAGRVSPIIEESLSFTIDGQIGELQVEQFTFVSAGDVLAALDTNHLAAALLAVQAETQHPTPAPNRPHDHTHSCPHIHVGHYSARHDAT